MATIGRGLIALGLVLLVAGGLILLAGRLGLPLGKLPGDLVVRGKRVTFFAPVATCLLLPIALSVLLWLVSLLRR